MQQAVDLSGNKSYWAMPSNTAIWISSLFRDRAKAELIYFPVSEAIFFMMFHQFLRTHLLDYILDIRISHEFISQLISYFNTAFFYFVNLYKCRYQTRERNITKLYLRIPKHIIIRLAKLQIDILNLNTFFWHCKKNRLLWTRVYLSRMT